MDKKQNENKTAIQEFNENKSNVVSMENISDESLEKKKRNVLYSHLVDDYADYINKTIDFKYKSRIAVSTLLVTVFILIIGICLYMSFYILPSLLKNDNHKVAESLITVSTTFGTLISTIIVLPKVIVEFIFNKEEDQYIVDLIKHTQDFDNNNQIINNHCH